MKFWKKFLSSGNNVSLLDISGAIKMNLLEVMYGVICVWWYSVNLEAVSHGMDESMVLAWHSNIISGSGSVTHPHPSYWFCWRAKRCEGLVCSYSSVGEMERGLAPPMNTRSPQKRHGRHNYSQRHTGSAEARINNDHAHQVGGDKSTTEVRNTYKLPYEKVAIGTWNVHTLYSCGKVIELEYKLKSYQWDLIGLTEVRWNSFGETVTRCGTADMSCNLNME